MRRVFTRWDVTKHNDNNFIVHFEEVSSIEEGMDSTVISDCCVLSDKLLADRPVVLENIYLCNCAYYFS